MPTVQVTIPENDLSESEKENFVNIQIRETGSGGYAVGGEIIG